MKMVVAIIQPQQLPAVKNALFDAGILHLTVTNVLGTAPEGAAKHHFRGVEYEISLFQKVRLELPLKESMVETAIEAITLGASKTGGFGIIFVTELHDVVVVKTGDRGEDAVQ